MSPKSDQDGMMKLVYTTIGKKDAVKFAKRIVKEKLAACINLWNIISVYNWKGKIEKAEETALLIKTADAERLLEWLKENHPYQLPALIVIEAEAEEEFEKWVEKCG